MDDKFCKLFDFPELGGQVLLMKVLDEDSEPTLELRTFSKGNSAVSKLDVEREEIEQLFEEYDRQRAEKYYRGVCFLMGKDVKSIISTPSAIDLIAAERQSQITKHGFTIEHDLATYKGEELSTLAVYALTGVDEWIHGYGFDQHYIDKIDGKSEKEKYVTAAALIAAEIDMIIAKETKEG